MVRTSDLKRRIAQDLDEARRRTHELLLPVDDERLMTQQAVEIHYNETHRLVPKKDYPPNDTGPGFIGAPIELHTTNGGIRLGARDVEAEK